ncbi:uncharacterized protein LOC110711149 [Chenopodium quinoa]|uniref:uncharacterized protein LOC110711149 n=1 Tax=Chenopodium quinoa TaxID=63459 RepID=UPI000B776E69|nr:uncharacterized protein LOC110711149 [Chenopodium quinoa]
MVGRKYEIGVFDTETLEQGTKVGDYLSWLLTLQRLVGFVDGHSMSPPPLYLLDQHGHQYQNPSYAHWTRTQQLSRDVLAKVQHLVNTSGLWTSDLEHRFDTCTLNAALLQLKRTLINPDTATQQAAIHSCNLTEIVRQVKLVSVILLPSVLTWLIGLICQKMLSLRLQVLCLFIRF